MRKKRIMRTNQNQLCSGGNQSIIFNTWSLMKTEQRINSLLVEYICPMFTMSQSHVQYLNTVKEKTIRKHDA